MGRAGVAVEYQLRAFFRSTSAQFCALSKLIGSISYRSRHLLKPMSERLRDMFGFRPPPWESLQVVP